MWAGYVLLQLCNLLDCRGPIRGFPDTGYLGKNLMGYRTCAFFKENPRLDFYICKWILHFFTKQINPRSLGSTLNRKDSSVSHMHHDPRQLGFICLEKKCTLTSLLTEHHCLLLSHHEICKHRCSCKYVCIGRLTYLNLMLVLVYQEIRRHYGLLKTFKL